MSVGAVNLPERTGAVRVHVGLTYDGTGFHGWTAQPGLRTVQGEIETIPALVARISLVFTVTGHTDAGAHARRQVTRVDIPFGAWQTFTPHSTDREDNTTIGTALARRLNALTTQTRGEWGRRHRLLIPRGSFDIVISRINRVSTNFGTRFSVLGRSYYYRICEDTPDPLRRRGVLSISGPLNLEAMNRGAAALLDEHDFLSYCRPRKGATAIRTLKHLEFTHLGGIIECRVEADAFYHSMVRSLVGAHLPIGRGKKPESWSAQLLEKCSHGGTAPVAPAHGLTLENMHYPEEEQWASRAKTTR